MLDIEVLGIQRESHVKLLIVSKLTGFPNHTAYRGINCKTHTVKDHRVDSGDATKPYNVKSIDYFRTIVNIKVDKEVNILMIQRSHKAFSNILKGDGYFEGSLKLRMKEGS